MSDLAQRMADLSERNDAPHVTDAVAKELFIGYLKDGFTRGEAARKAGRTSTWFRRRCNPEASNYDPVFSERYQRADSQNRAQIVDDTFTALYKSAQEGNVRAQEKILAAYSEEFGFLRPPAAGAVTNIEQLQVFFGELPLSKLLELKEAREKAKMKELPVIDQ